MKKEYPFSSRYIEIDGHKMHYIDEGVGETILFVHGTPVWSYVWRKYIASLSKNYRCIAIDHIGFGLSDKPENYDGSVQNLSANLKTFIDALELKNITLVVHDFGGPIGLSNAIASPDQYKKLIIFNTWLWQTKDLKSIQKVDKFLDSLIGKFAYKALNFPINVLLKGAFLDKSKLTKELKQKYKNVFKSKQDRNGLYDIAKSLFDASDWYEQKWDNIDNITQIDTLFIWGDSDPFFSMEYLDKWKRKFTRATTHVVSSGHFVQEEASLESLQFIQKFLER